MENSKIYVWGTGVLSDFMVKSGLPLDKITAFLNDDPGVEQFYGKPVLLPRDIVNENYSLIIVAISYEEIIEKKCIELGIDLNKVDFPFAISDRYLKNNKNASAEKLLGVDYSALGNERIKGKPELLINQKMYKFDYIKFKTFELCAKEIKRRKIQGSIAELGVFRGVFSRYINYVFPDRKMYLFDTFEGFIEDEIVMDEKNGIDTKWCNSFKLTDTDIVKNNMANKDNIIIRQGFFPTTAEGLEDERFAFVSLDTDFETPIYSGLRFFYPRLNKGGYIFIHDYSFEFSRLQGIIKAVDRYEEEEGIMLNKVPLCDNYGTLVISK